MMNGEFNTITNPQNVIEGIMDSSRPPHPVLVRQF